MPTARKEELKVLPGFSQGVRDNAATRMITLARPICPYSKITIELDSNNRPVPIKAPGPGNCQMEGGEWWVRCQEMGHDPYFTTYTWETSRPIIEQDDEGRMIKTGEEIIYHEEKRLNTAQVAQTLRHNNGMGVQDKMRTAGFRLLRDFGYAEVCQFRNCQKPVTPEGTSRKYGRYCSKEHLALIGAAAEEIMLYSKQTPGGIEGSKALKKRERQLAEVLLGAS